jgi:hypothetical protein
VLIASAAHEWTEQKSITCSEIAASSLALIRGGWIHL